MDLEVDHYSVLGLPSGEEGLKLTRKEICKACKLKALTLHPDKRPDDPKAHANFQKLMSLYEVLKNEKARKLLSKKKKKEKARKLSDSTLRVKLEQQRRHLQSNAKCRRMMSGLEETDPAAIAREAEERIARMVREEIERVKGKSRFSVFPNFKTSNKRCYADVVTNTPVESVCGDLPNPPPVTTKPMDLIA